MDEVAEVCGIAGSFLVSGFVHKRDAFAHALRALHHRGPDGEGVRTFDLTEGSLALLHRRLSIIDLSPAGLQPMESADGRYIITFNGEIYNYIELREQLVRKGYHFRTKTDTEVLLSAWQEWGSGCLLRFDGMFAFAIYDRLANSLVCARDPFGIKPFFYSTGEEGFHFASELKSLIELLPNPPRLNMHRAYDYLCWGNYDDGDDTFYAGVRQLKPGHYLKLDLGKAVSIKCQRWWWPRIDAHCNLSFEDSADKLRDLFLNSVRRQLRSDVAVGAALSGGVDSSAIVCAIRHLEPDVPIHTFSYFPQGSEFNEEVWARKVTERVRADVHWSDYDSADMANDIDDIIRTQGEPFGSTSIAAQYRVFRLARENDVTVVLDGQGADELLAGYDGYPTAIFRSFIERGEYLELFNFIRAWQRWPRRSWKLAALHLGDAMVPSYMRDLAFRAIGRSSTPAWIQEQILREAGVVLKPPSPFPTDKQGKGRRLCERLRTALTSNRLPALLRHADRNSMRWSVESRVPFLSPAIAEFTLSLPEHYLVSEEGQTKHIFRRAMRGIVPGEILDRRDKIGFETPERDVLIKQRDRIETWLEAAFHVDFINAEKLRKEVEAVLDGKVSFSFRAWRVINFCRWISLTKLASE